MAAPDGVGAELFPVTLAPPRAFTLFALRLDRLPPGDPRYPLRVGTMFDPSFDDRRMGRAESAGLLLLIAGGGALLYGVSAMYLLPGLLHGVQAKGGPVPIFAGLVMLTIGAILRVRD